MLKSSSLSLRTIQRSTQPALRLASTQAPTRRTPNTASDVLTPPHNAGTPENPTRSINLVMLALGGGLVLLGGWAAFRSGTAEDVSNQTTASITDKGKQRASKAQ